MNLGSTLQAQAPRALTILRIFIGLLFFGHGLNKLFGFPPSPGPMPVFLTMLWFQGLIEFVGGGLLALGLFTRLAAFVMAGDMAVAYFMVFSPKGFFPQYNGGETAVLFSWIFFYFVFAGGGAWSLDRMLGRKDA